MHRTECSHRVLQILEFNALGASVGCIHCNTTLQLAADVMEEGYYAFTHVSPKGATHDVQILVHPSLMIETP